MIDVIFGGTHVCVLLDFGPGVTRWHYHNNHRFIMRTDNVSKVTLSVQNSFSIIMCKFRAVQSKTEGMAASVCVFLNTLVLNDTHILLPSPLVKLAMSWEYHFSSPESNAHG